MSPADQILSSQKTFLTFRTRFLDSIPKPHVVVRSLPPFSKDFWRCAIRSFKLEVIHGLSVAEILTFLVA